MVNADLYEKLKVLKGDGKSFDRFLEDVYNSFNGLNQKHIGHDRLLIEVGKKSMKYDDEIDRLNALKRDILEDDIFKRLINLLKDVKLSSERYVSQEVKSIWESRFTEIINDFDKRVK